VKELYVIENGLHEIYIDYEKDKFFQKVLSWILNTRNFGKSNLRIILLYNVINLAFPIDLKFGPINKNKDKFRSSWFLKILLAIVYFFIAYK
jgi:hypothetical protein